MTRAAPSGCGRFGRMLGCAVALVLAAGAPGANADEPFDVSADIVVEMVTATPAPAGGKSDLRFRIVNEGQERLVLLGVTSPIAARADLVAGLGARRTTVLQSFAIAPGETLDLTTSHLRYEIFPLNRPLVAGEEFPVTLNFVGFSITVSAHVHRTPQTGSGGIRIPGAAPHPAHSRLSATAQPGAGRQAS